MAIIAISSAAALLICALSVGLIAVCVRKSKSKPAKHQDDSVAMDVQMPVNSRGSTLSVIIPSGADITDIDIKEHLGGGNFSEVFKGENRQRFMKAEICLQLNGKEQPMLQQRNSKTQTKSLNS